MMKISMDTDQSAEIRRRDLPHPKQECLQLSRYLQRQRRRLEDNIKTDLKKLGFDDWRLMELIHDSVLLRTWILTVLPFGFQVVSLKETSRCSLIKGIAGRMPLKHGETCDRKKLLRLANEYFPRGLSTRATVIPTFANAKILCRFK